MDRELPDVPSLVICAAFTSTKPISLACAILLMVKDLPEPDVPVKIKCGLILHSLVLNISIILDTSLTNMSCPTIDVIMDLVWFVNKMRGIAYSPLYEHAPMDFMMIP